jgi:hypothetical protein
MKLAMLTCVLVVAILTDNGGVFSADSPELRKKLAGWKPLMELNSRTLGQRYRRLPTELTGYRQSQTFLFLRSGKTSGRKDGVHFISAYGKRNGRWCLRFPSPEGTPIGSGTAMRMTLRHFYDFTPGGSDKPKSMTIALMQDSDYRGLTYGWSHHKLDSEKAYRLIIEQKRLALLGPSGKAKWIPLTDSAWKAEDENDVTFIVTADAVEFWLNGKRTASQPIADSLPPFNWVHVNLPHLHWGFMKYSFLAKAPVKSKTTKSKAAKDKTP